MLWKLQNIAGKYFVAVNYNAFPAKQFSFFFAPSCKAPDCSVTLNHPMAGNAPKRISIKRVPHSARRTGMAYLSGNRGVRRDLAAGYPLCTGPHQAVETRLARRP